MLAGSKVLHMMRKGQARLAFNRPRPSPSSSPSSLTEGALRSALSRLRTKHAAEALP
jgi:hypothetical protein